MYNPASRDAFVSLTVVALGLCTTSIAAQQGGFDAVPFGRPLVGSDSFGVEWTEMRRIARVEVIFPRAGSSLPSPEGE